MLDQEFTIDLPKYSDPEKTGTIISMEKTLPFITFDEPTGQITLSNPEPGDYEIKMKLEDDDGFSATYPMKVKVEDVDEETEEKEETVETDETSENDTKKETK